MLYLGIDFGTSGVRGITIDANGQILTQVSITYPQDGNLPHTQSWQKALWAIISQIPLPLRQQIGAIAINGTSSTVLLCDRNGYPVDNPLLYNDDRGQSMLPHIREIAPSQHTVVSATSSLAKLLWMQAQPSAANAEYLLHQADWLAFLLHGQLGISDYHNALKLGYDVGELKYPSWLQNFNLRVKLPQVLSPGTPIATIKPEIASQFDFPSTCLICAGTTDSIAAFFASGVQQPGEAVTSLGSTLVIKLLSYTRLDRSDWGIYSHRFPDFSNASNQPIWLVGGASNTGGAVLRHFFSDEEIMEFSQQINPELTSSLDYYPLLKPGERFPINDANLQPRLTPRPANQVEFLHGLLESMARIEAQAYEKLQQLGATQLVRVYTAGGGAKNTVWRKIRQKYLQIPVENSLQTEAAYGSALLAMGGSKASIFTKSS